MTRDDSSRYVATAAGRRRAKKRTTNVGRTGARFPSARVIAQNEPDEPTENDGDHSGPPSQPIQPSQASAPDGTTTPETTGLAPPPPPTPTPPPPPPAGSWSADPEQPSATGWPSATNREPASGRHSAADPPSFPGRTPVADWSPVPDPATPGPAHSTADADPHEDTDAPIGARFGPYSARKPKRAKEFDTGSTPVVVDARPREPGEPTPEQSAERTMPMVLPWAGALVRPYAHTGGRTRSSRDLAIEALVSTSEQPATPATTAALDEALTTHHRRRIVDICIRPRSVAEIAALLSVPLGVARVLLGDLATAGAVIVHPTAGTTGDGAPDLDFMRRVLVGLRRL